MEILPPHDALARAKGFLDEATENITFDRYAWAFEEVWQGVGWALNALLPICRTELGLGEKGERPITGSLRALLSAGAHWPAEAQVAQKLEALRRALDDTADTAQADALLAERIPALVFEAWTLHDACGVKLGVTDERLDGKWMLAEAAPGRIASRVVGRRTALKFLAAGSLLPLAACMKIERDNRGPGAVAREPSQATQASAPGAPLAQKPAAIRSVQPLPPMQWPTSDPFLFCAYHVDDYPVGDGQMGPAASLAGRHLGRDFEGQDNWRMYHGTTIPGFPRHPHRGFETVTVVRTGMLDHADSMGATARYGGGDVQWLTAGQGMQHAEMFPLLRADAPNPLELFQIWLNLPRANKMVDPHFTMLWKEKIPRIVDRDARGRTTEITITAGAWKGQRPPSPPPNSWASDPRSDLAIMTLRMEPGATFELPPVAEGTHRSLYVHRGVGAKVAGQDIANNHRVVVHEQGAIALEAGSQPTEILLLQGRPIGEPVAQRGPFVMNTQEEIQQAWMDYRRTQFGGWPWGPDDPVHAGTKGRFAQRPGGGRETPG